MGTIRKEEIMKRVRRCDTGETLDGIPSRILIDESDNAGPTGAVLAYRDLVGTWRAVAPENRNQLEREGHEVLTVYVEED